MNVNGVIYITLLFFLLVHSAVSKSLYNIKLSSSNDEVYPVKRLAPNPSEFVMDGTPELSFENANVIPLTDKKEIGPNIESNHKRSSNIENTLNLKTETIKKRNLFTDHLKEDLPYGVVFSHGKAIGVLKPLSTAYELASFDEGKEAMLETNPIMAHSNNNQMKREVSDISNELGEDDQHETAKYSSGRYPEILANFKIGNRLQMLKNGYEHKRDNMLTKKTNLNTHPNSMGNNKFDRLLTKRDNQNVRKNLDTINVNAHQEGQQETQQDIANLKDSSEIDEIEDTLRGVIGDLGLVDQEDSEVKDQEDSQGKDKRSADLKDSELNTEKRDAKEDEDMEHGDNKITLKKAVDTDRKKKESEFEEKCSSKAPLDTPVATGETKDEKRSADSKEKEAKNDNLKKVKRESTETVGESLSVAESLNESENIPLSDEAEEPSIVRKKRQEKPTGSQENSDLIKGLESSGELTVSGNKSPLATATNEHDVDLRETECTKPSVESKQKRESKEDAKLKYEKQIEKNLQDKINAIKEQVKREIDALKQAKKEDKEPVRAKRNAAENTLLSEEKINLDPNLHDENLMQPHVRSKRDLDIGSSDEQVIVENGFVGGGDSKRINKRETKINNAAAEASSSAVKESQPVKRSETQSTNEKANKEQSVQNTNKRVERFDHSSLSDVSSCKSNVKPLLQTDNKFKDLDVSATPNLEEKSCPGKIKRKTESIQRSDGLNSHKVDRRLEKRAVNWNHRTRNNLDNSRFVYTRRKRADSDVPVSNMAYFPFRSEDDEVDDEGDEFDDDGFDDRSSNLVRRRRADYRSYYPINKRAVDEYDTLTDQDYDMSDNVENEYYPTGLRLVKRDSIAQTYVDNLNEDTDNNNYYDNQEGYVRSKRQAMDDVAAVHGGSATEQRLAAAKERIQNPSQRSFRKKRLGKDMSMKDMNMKDMGNIIQNDKSAELTDSDLFGGLPQSYEGELSRFKRVKRARSNLRNNG